MSYCVGSDTVLVNKAKGLFRVYMLWYCLILRTVSPCNKGPIYNITLVSSVRSVTMSDAQNMNAEQSDASPSAQTPTPTRGLTSVDAATAHAGGPVRSRGKDPQRHLLLSEALGSKFKPNVDRRLSDVVVECMRDRHHSGYRTIRIANLLTLPLHIPYKTDYTRDISRIFSQLSSFAKSVHGATDELRRVVAVVSQLLHLVRSVQPTAEGVYTISLGNNEVRLLEQAHAALESCLATRVNPVFIVKDVEFN